ncbi:unnamed protein product [Euphydryas editha]|uniref:Uncharacterized protein n=1 Tax=Euphydryas editha TaxID=104508 RepID=A0AAU9UI52_EUPED|nr:unnamed protein product [Euphydryas editha]
MATSYQVNVPMLKLRENYNEWTFAAENFLILEDKLHCIKPETGKVIEAADDARTKAKLIMTIDSVRCLHQRREDYVGAMEQIKGIIR